MRATDQRVELFHDDRRVAEHARHGPRRSTIEEHLPAGRRDLVHRGRRFWEDRAERVGPWTLALVRRSFDSDDVLSRLRQVQATVRHLEQFPRVRAEATCRLALEVDDPSYHGVKQILAVGADLHRRP